PRPARRLLRHPSPCGVADVPQLGPAPTPTALRRPAAGQGGLTVMTVVDSHLDAAAERSLADDVLDGLTRPFKELPPKHFYDARGSELFERISRNLWARRVNRGPYGQRRGA